ncbi:MAG: thiamine-phosphate synthase family protein [Thermoplasmatota archaeon]
MLPPHIVVTEEILPEVRRRMAMSLYSRGMSQTVIAQLLGTSQARVSKYLKEETRLPASLEELVDTISKELETAAIAGSGRSELTDRFCGLLESCMAEGMLRERYTERFGEGSCRCCYGTTGAGSSRSIVLEDLALAVEFLKGEPIPRLVPALKINIAYALPGASSPMDVASFPGRIPDRNGILMDPYRSEFGASKHLAGKLIEVIRGGGDLRAVISLRYDEDVGALLEKMGCGKDLVKSEGGGKKSAVGKRTWDPDTVMVDPGDFGIEPCLYIFGRTPLEVARKAAELHARIEKGE